MKNFISYILHTARGKLFGPLVSNLIWYYKLNIEKTKSSVDNYKAEFLTNSRSEYWRVKNFVGEERILEDILDRLEGGERYWDVGANIGTHAVFPGKKLTNGHVTAFEPMPAVSERLKTNLDKNVDKEQWSVEQVGLYSRTGQKTMKVGSDDPGSGTHSISQEGNITIELQRADEYIQTNNLPEVVKIDVEGTELEVLNGFGDYLSEIQLLYVEVHPSELKKYGGTEEQVLDRLNEAGFKIQERIERDPSGDTYHVVAQSRES
jgi:FkbM family methyltransferase